MRVLVVDDLPEFRTSMRCILRSVNGIEVVEAATRTAAFDAAANSDLMFVDTCLDDDPSNDDGLRLLDDLASSGKAIPTVVTGSSDPTDRARATSLGAWAYLDKKDLCAELVAPFVRAMLVHHGVHAVRQRGVDTLIGSSHAMQALRRTVRRLAQSDEPVLVLGESGCGKELIARALHEESGRADRPFVSVNCAAIPRDLLESTLFGHEKGAFTGADRRCTGRLVAAADGTIVLDEIAELPVDLQAKLLRVLEQRTFLPVGGGSELPLSARVIASTNADLRARVREDLFRGDLFYRLDVLSVLAPSLRERGPDDVEELTLFFANNCSTRPTFTSEALVRLAQHSWPGNVRELRNVVARIALMVDRLPVRAHDIDGLVHAGATTTRTGTALTAIIDSILDRPDAPAFEHLMDLVALRALERAGGNQSEAARMLGTSRYALRRRLEKIERRCASGQGPVHRAPIVRQ